MLPAPGGESVQWVRSFHEWVDQSRNLSASPPTQPAANLHQPNPKSNLNKTHKIVFTPCSLSQVLGKKSHAWTGEETCLKFVFYVLPHSSESDVDTRFRKQRALSSPFCSLRAAQRTTLAICRAATLGSSLALNASRRSCRRLLQPSGCLAHDFGHLPGA